MERDVQERARLSAEGEGEREASFRVFSDQSASDEQPTSTKTATVAPQTSEQFLVRQTATSTPVLFEDVLNKLVLETLTRRSTCVYF